MRRFSRYCIRRSTRSPDNALFIVARTAQEPQELLKSLEATVHRIDPEILTFNAETMEDRCGMDDAGHHEGSRGGRMRLFLVFGSLHRSSRITTSIELNRKAGWGNGPCPLRPLDERGTIVYRFRRFRFR